MNICYVAVDVSIPAPTGGSTHTLELARALSQQDNNVYIVSRREKNQSKHAKIDGINIYRIYRLILVPAPLNKEKLVFGKNNCASCLRQIYHLYLRTIYALYAGIMTARIVKKCDIHIILERQSSLGAGAIAAKLTHRPILVEVVSPFHGYLSYRLAKKILVYSVNSLPSDVNPAKVVETTAAVNMRLFNPEVDGQKIRERYSLKGKPVIGYAGGFLEWHGVHTLIQASLHVIARHPQSAFLMVGPHYHEYKQQARSLGVDDHFIFVGPVPYKEVACYLAAANVLVAPYCPGKHVLGSPLKLFEYLALKKPVVATEIPLIEKIIVNGETVVLVPPCDSKALGKQINELLENTQLAERIARNGYELVKAKYSWQKIAETVRACMRDAVKRQPVRSSRREGQKLSE